MKFIVSQSDLNKALSLVSKAVPSKPTHPILGNLLLRIDNDENLTLVGFDLSLGITLSIVVQVIEQGSITIPAGLLSQIISKLNNEDELTFEVDNESNTVQITSTTGRYQLSGVESGEYPELPVVNEENQFNIKVGTLIDGLKATIFSASGNETTQVLTGVHFCSKDNLLEIASTDGHRLSVFSQENEDENNFALTIPSRALKEVFTMVNGLDSEDEAIIKYDDNQLIFESQNQKLFSRILCGTYPQYNQLIPLNFELSVVIDRKKLISSIERVGILADQKNNIVKFDINPDEQTVSLSVETREVGSGKERLTAQIGGEKLIIAFNIKYLLEGLKAITTSEIELKLNQFNTPVVIYPVGGNKYQYLIMPVQIRD